jgi:hypothetical protein
MDNLLMFFGDTFTPADVAGLRCWLRSDEGVSLTGGLVSGWADQSGFGNNASQSVAGSRPSYSSTLNGRPVITFDGTADHLRVDSLSSLFHGNDTPNSVFAAVRAETSPLAAASRVLAASTNGSLNNRHGGISLNTVPAITTDRTAVGADAAALAYPVNYGTNLIVVGTTFAGTTTTIWLNGVAVATGSLNVGTLGTNINRVTIGCIIVNVIMAYFAGDIAEILVYNNAVNNDDSLKIQNYLSKRWQL